MADRLLACQEMFVMNTYVDLFAINKGILLHSLKQYNFVQCLVMFKKDKSAYLLFFLLYISFPCLCKRVLT